MDGNAYPYEHGTTWMAHSGDKYLGSASADGAQNNDWLISPQLSFAANPRISFFAKSLEAGYNPASFNVLYSTNGNSYSDFAGNYLNISQPQTVGTDWTLFEYALPASCANTNVYIAIQYVSDARAMLMIDDFVAVRDELLVITVPGPESVVGGEIPDGLLGNNAGENTLVYTVTATGINEVIVTNPGWQADWYCWIVVGSTVYAGDNPIPAATASFTFPGIDFDARGDVVVVINDENDETLPVTLSSFTAVLTAEQYVKLQWTTQSETGVSGFYVYRSSASTLSDAIMVSPIIGATNTGDQHNYEYVDAELYDTGSYYYWLSVRNMDGSEDYHGPIAVNYNPGGEEVTAEIPLVSGLSSIYPNPFNPSTTIAYGLSKNAELSFVIYNARGQIVRRISEGQKAAGNWKLIWNGLDDNGHNCPTGIYHIRMNAGKESFVKKVALLK